MDDACDKKDDCPLGTFLNFDFLEVNKEEKGASHPTPSLVTIPTTMGQNIPARVPTPLEMPIKTLA